MKITAVLLHYWKERTKNIGRIIDDLNSGSRKPDKIIVFNNNKEITYPSKSGISVINSDTNYGARSRACIALLEPSDFYYFIDDDTTVRKDTLRNLAINAYKYSCCGYRGIILNPNYEQGINIWADSIETETEVDVLAGNGTLFVPHNLLLKMFVKEKKLLRDGWEFRKNAVEDLIMSAPHSFVIPAEGSEFITNLDDGNVGLCKKKEHWAVRNDVARRLDEL